MRRAGLCFAICATLLSLVAGGANAALFATSGLVRISQGDPFAACTADNVTGQPGTNYAATEVEPWIDVNPAKTANVVGIWQQDRWSDGGSRGLVAGVTFDGGATWKSVVIPKGSRCPGGIYDRASDPWLSFGPDGDLYAISLALSHDATESAILVNKSVDGGVTWSNAKTLIHDTTADTFNDKQTITADPTNADFVYAVWDRGRSGAAGSDVMFSRTTDGGVTWETPRAIYAPNAVESSVGNQIVVQPNGTLVDVTEWSTAAGDFVAVLRSTDKGATWSAPKVVAAQRALNVREPDTNKLVRAGAELPEVGVDPTTGRLYAVWMDSRFSNGSIDEIALSRSTDGGLTWSAPIKVNKTPSSIALLNRQAFTPSVEVAANGTVAVTYYDFRKNTSASGVPTDYWLVHCHSGCTNRANWSETHVAGSFNIKRAPNARGYFLGDYEGLAAVGGGFRAFFAHPTSSDRANVYFAKVGP
jgi:BNR repeat-like domain